MARYHCLRRQRGQNIVELTLLAVFLSTIVLGMIDFGRVFYAPVGITNATPVRSRPPSWLPRTSPRVLAGSWYS